MSNFALIGAAGYIAPRHMKAIKDTGNQLVAATDPHDSVGIVDSYFPKTRFFTEIERFDRHLEKLRRRPVGESVDYVSICSPNFLHDAHIRLALRVNAHAICEKPLVINPWNLDQLELLQDEYQKKVYTVLQLRQHPAVVRLKESLAQQSRQNRADVVLTYITRRGAWYGASWKGNEEKSGGIAMNIGIHFFDLLLWLFGAVQKTEVNLMQSDKMSGQLELERARVRWFLSLDENDLPDEVQMQGGYASRGLSVDGEEVDFNTGFTDLHTLVYQDILSGGGTGIADARPSIETVYQIRNSEVVTPCSGAHPLLAR